VKLKTLVISVVAGFALVGTQAALACSLAAWGGGTPAPPGGGAIGGPVAGEPDDATPTKRYAGRCGLRSAGAGQYVQDGNPLAESRLRARFYVFTGTTGGNPVVFRGLNAADAQIIAVTYNGTTGAFDFTSGATTASTAAASVVANRWYAVELDWNTGTSNMTATVQGNNQAALPTVTVGAASGAIDYVQLGWISGAATGAIQTDAYESRRATAIGFLCKGDANADNSRNSGDLVQIRNEFLASPAGFLASGTPDANEDGNVNSGDLVIVRNLFLAGNGACS
jgi:hypothetical protein